jgi:hypothetical protein
MSSTIFDCDESSSVCLFRLAEGVVALLSALNFSRAYLAISRDKSRNFSSLDRSIFVLTTAEAYVLAAYYLLFEEFFMLATVRSLMIWASLCLLEAFSLLYYTDNYTRTLLEWGVAALRGCNFLLWFYVAVVHGTTLENKDFNVGYNCLLSDWMFLSAFYCLVSGLNLYVVAMLKLKIQREMANAEPNSPALAYASDELFSLNVYFLSSLLSPLLLFVWDFTAFSSSHRPDDCVLFFSGTEMPGTLLRFGLKIVGLQLPLQVIYYCMYLRRKESMVQAILPENNLELLYDRRSTLLLHESRDSQY